MKEWRKRAAFLDANAMSWLGYAYGWGEYGIQKDCKQARVWFERRANLSDTGCMVKYGDSLLEGWGGDTSITLGVFTVRRQAKWQTKLRAWRAIFSGWVLQRGNMDCLSTMSRPGCGLRSTST